MAKKLTGFELAPQGQIGSGLAQVFDTSNLVQAAVQMREFKRQQFDGLISSLADIDPKLAHPKDTEDIVYGVNQLYDYVVENYQSIADPRQDPSKAIEFRRRKNELLGAVHTSQKMGEVAIKHTDEMRKNDLTMGAYNQNSNLISALNTEKVFTRNEDGTLVRNQNVNRLFSETLAIAKNPNDFATELADKTKPQFDPNNPNLQQIRLSNGTYVMLHPDKVTDAQADQIIRDALTGSSVDALAVTNGVLGREVLFDTLSPDEQSRVIASVRPLFKQRLDTKPSTNVVRDPSNFGQQKRAFDFDTRNRSLLSIATGEDGGSGILSDQNWGDTGSQVQRVNRTTNENGELVYSVVLKSGNTISTKDYVVGQEVDGKLYMGEDVGDEYKNDLVSFLTAANFTLNKRQGGDVATPDIENILSSFMGLVRQEIDAGRFNVRVGTDDIYTLNQSPATKTDVATALDGVIGDTSTTRELTTAVNDIQKWAVKQEYNTSAIKITPSNKPNVVVVHVGGNKASYDLSDTTARQEFVNAYIERVALPTSGTRPTKSIPVGKRGGATVENPFD